MCLATSGGIAIRAKWWHIRVYLNPGIHKTNMQLLPPCKRKGVQGEGTALSTSVAKAHDMASARRTLVVSTVAQCTTQALLHTLGAKSYWCALETGLPAGHTAQQLQSCPRTETFCGRPLQAGGREVQTQLASVTRYSLSAASQGFNLFSWSHLYHTPQHAEHSPISVRRCAHRRFCPQQVPAQQETDTFPPCRSAHG